MLLLSNISSSVRTKLFRNDAVRACGEENQQDGAFGNCKVTINSIGANICSAWRTLGTRRGSPAHC